jgi:hypothetical protein
MDDLLGTSTINMGRALLPAHSSRGSRPPPTLATDAAKKWESKPNDDLVFWVFLGTMDGSLSRGALSGRETGRCLLVSVEEKEVA